MKKIILIGSGGAGKSTLARKIGEKLAMNVVHLDALFWKPNWTPVTKGEQRRIQDELVQNDTWIIDGNYGATIDIRMKAADTIIFLDISRTICLYRVLKRRLKYRNRTRPDMGAGCNEKIDIHFLKWIWEYPKTKKPEILMKLKQYEEEKELIILKTPREIEVFLDKL